MHKVHTQKQSEDFRKVLLQLLGKLEAEHQTCDARLLFAEQSQ